jgi:fructose-1,6-bisphosphatase II
VTQQARTGPRPDRNLALELVRATEAAAIGGARHLGRGDKEAVDQAAVDAMRPVMGQIAMDGVVVIGEGEKDNAPMLYNGERVGDGSPPEVDIAVDPVDGTTLTARSLPNAIAVVALAERGSMFDPGPCVYMEKLAVGRDAAAVVDFEAPIEDNLRRIAQAKGSDVTELTVCILDRPRHEEELVGRVRATGARIKFLRPQVPRRSPVRALVAPQRRRTPGRSGRRLRPRQGPDHRRPGPRGQRLLRRHRGHRRGAAARGPLPGP